MIKFSIITVTYNSGEKLLKTVQSILDQSYPHFEIIIKDGLSTDDSLSTLPDDNRIRIYSEADHGIYDAMNRAVDYADGQFYLFLNCGDIFNNKNVLGKVAEEIEQDKESADLYYGDVYVATRGGVIKAPDVLDDFTLITRTICHQCLFFSAKIFEISKYEFGRFGLAADMGLYIECLKKYKMNAHHMNFIVSNYEGGGASETARTKKQIISAKKAIMREYYTKAEQRAVKIKKIFKMKYLKDWISSSQLFYAAYEKIASFVNQKQTNSYFEK